MGPGEQDQASHRGRPPAADGPSTQGSPPDEFAIAEWVRSQTGATPWWPAVEPTRRWVRVRLGDRVVADSRRAMLLVQYGPPPMLPTYYFPPDDVDVDALTDRVERADGSTRWTVAADGLEVEGGAWTHPRAHGKLAAIAGMVTFTWWDELRWFEEEEPLFAHAMDPHKRVDVVPSSRQVRVLVDGVTVADSFRPTILFETALPPRFYLPAEDVRTELLIPSATRSQCPYKGTARYWSVLVKGTEHRDLAWGYPDPVPENPRIRDLICFFNERVDLVVDGEQWDRPTSPWS